MRKGNGFVVGTASSGLDGDDQNLFDVRNVTFRDSVAIDTTFACHIKAKPPQRGTVSDVLFQNIYSLQLENSTDYRIKHGDHAGYVIGIHLFDQGRRRLMSAVDEENATSSSAVQVNASNITFSNVSFEGWGWGWGGGVTVQHLLTLTTLWQITANAVYAGDFQCSQDEKIVRCRGIVLKDVVLNVSRGGCNFGNGIEGRAEKVEPQSCRNVR